MPIEFSWGGNPLAAGTQVVIGNGTGLATLGGTYAKFVSGSGVGNTADTNNDALWTLTPLPANTLTANGDALVLTLALQTGATANNKQIGLTVGGTQVNSAVVTWNAFTVVATAIIERVDATHVNVAFNLIGSSASTANGSFNVAVSDLTSNTLAIVVTGTSGTTGAANDVKLFSGIADVKK